MADIGEHVKSAAPRLTLDHSVGDKLSHPMLTLTLDHPVGDNFSYPILITAFGLRLFDLQVNEKSATRLARPRNPVDFEVIPFCNTLTHRAHLPRK